VIGSSGRLVAVGSLHMEQVGDDGGVQPLNMSVPAQLLPPILEALLGGRPPRPPQPWLGVLLQQAGESVIVVGAPPGGPASRAEIRRGDVIVGLEGAPVTDLADFYRRLWALGAAGVDVPLTLRREDDVFDVTVRSIDRMQLLKKPRYN
jgi:S1-C subfamily serine protease